MCITVLHDDPLWPDLLRAELTRHGHVCHFFIRDVSPLIANWRLGGMDGMALLRRLRQTAWQQRRLLRRRD
ncbi:MAG: hypothetical protein ACK5OA_15020 [Acidovorax sp.]|jgi:DNA-binding response OmpR family regulator